MVIRSYRVSTTCDVLSTMDDLYHNTLPRQIQSHYHKLPDQVDHVCNHQAKNDHHQCSPESLGTKDPRWFRRGRERALLLLYMRKDENEKDISNTDTWLIELREPFIRGLGTLLGSTECALNMILSIFFHYQFY